MTVVDIIIRDREEYKGAHSPTFSGTHMVTQELYIVDWLVSQATHDSYTVVNLTHVGHVSCMTPFSHSEFLLSFQMVNSL